MSKYFSENVDIRPYSWVRNVFDVNVNEIAENILRFQEIPMDVQENLMQNQRFETLIS